MSVLSDLSRRVARAFFHPRGLSGSAAGWISVAAPPTSGAIAGRSTFSTFSPPTRSLIGFRPGVAIAGLAERATAGRVVGVDPSPVMLRQASRRNAAAIRAGLVQLHMSPVEDLPEELGGPFDKLLAVNTAGAWPDPTARIVDLAGADAPGGRVALVSQPRCPGATAQTTVAAGRELAGYLRQAGFSDLRTETLDLRPPVVCVLGRR